MSLDVTNLYNVSNASLENESAQQSFSDLCLYDQSFYSTVTVIMNRALENKLITKTSVIAVIVNGSAEVYERIMREIGDCFELFNYTNGYSVKANFRKV